MKKFLGIIALAGAATLFSAGEALAVPISGSIEITGAVNGLTATDLTQVDFTSNGLVVDSSGDLAMAFGTQVALTDIVIAAPGQVWSVGGFTFTANGFSAPVLNGQGGKDFTASGTLMGAGFDNTVGTFEFSSNSGGGTASFSASTTNVPEPATLALFGVGLLGAGIATRRRKGQA